MSLAQLVEPVGKVAWVCRPEDAPFKTAMDLVSDRPNRWNGQGDATLYLSSDAGLALIESGRHPEDLTRAAHLLRVELRLRRALDLRRAAVRSELELPVEDSWILDRDRTRSLATRLRASGVCDGLLVPSAGALDHPDRWNAVVFADDPAGVGSLVGDPRRAGTVNLDAAAVPAGNRSG